LTELQSESTLIHLIRACILLAALIIVPAAAVCWNLIPKDFFENGDYEQPPATSADLAGNSEKMAESEESGEKFSNNEFAEESAATPSALFAAPQNGTALENPNIKLMGGTKENSVDSPIPNSFENQSAIALAATPAEPAPKYSTEFSPEHSIHSVNSSQSSPSVPSAPSFNARTIELSSPQNFPMLESQLKQLGAKYYRLEKWGNRGELFRFSCYVTPSGPYQYQKYFQAIDSDELRVMGIVIDDIKQWKGSD
jgi:hypothetical protein